MRQIPTSWGNLHISGGTPVYLVRIINTSGEVIARYSTLPINVTEGGSDIPIPYPGQIKSLPIMSYKIDITKTGGIVGVEPVKLRIFGDVGEWIGFKVEFYLTFQELGDIELESDTLMLFLGVIENIQKNTLYSVLEINSYFTYMLNREIFGEIIKEADYPYSPHIGEHKPTVFGHVECAPGWIKDARIQEDQYRTINPKVSWFDGKVPYTEIRRVMVDVGKKILARAAGNITINHSTGEAEWSDQDAKDGNLLVYIYLSGLNPKGESPCDPDNGLFYCNSENMFDGKEETYAQLGTGYDDGGTGIYPLENCPDIMKFEGCFFVAKINPTYTCDPDGDPDELTLSLLNNNISLQIWGTGVECGSIDNIWGDTPEQYPINITNCDILKNEFLKIERNTPHVTGPDYILNVAGIFVQIKAVLKEFIKQKFYADVVGRNIQNANIDPNGPITESPLGVIWSILADDLGIADYVDEGSFSLVRGRWYSSRATRVAGAVMNKPQRAMDVLREICSEFMLGLIFSGSKIKLFLIDPDRETDLDITNGEIKKDSLKVLGKSIFDVYGDMIFRYNKCYRDGVYKGLIEKSGAGELDFQKDFEFIRDKATAEEVAESIKNWAGVSRKQVTFKSWLNLIAIEPGDIVSIDNALYTGRIMVSNFKIDPNKSEVSIVGIEI